MFLTLYLAPPLPRYSLGRGRPPVGGGGREVPCGGLGGPNVPYCPSQTAPGTDPVGERPAGEGGRGGGEGRGRGGGVWSKGYNRLVRDLFVTSFVISL